MRSFTSEVGFRFQTLNERFIIELVVYYRTWAGHRPLEGSQKCGARFIGGVFVVVVVTDGTLTAMCVYLAVLEERETSNRCLPWSSVSILSLPTEYFGETHTGLPQCPRPSQRFEWKIHLRGQEVHWILQCGRKGIWSPGRGKSTRC
jgi:hypothetical protein